MIQPLRIAVLLLGICFAYFFGETLERFLLEVVRFFISLEPSNAILFNLIHLLTMLAPLMVLAIFVRIALGGEASLENRFHIIFWGIVLALISYRGCQIWWVFRGGIGEESSSWTESLEPSQLFFLEKIRFCK